ncbi:M81 family metallopeptidase, partial [Pseudomonas sp. NPDC089406]|uniref:M81 family metallopeptidase n=1 Tax=Pseudomonas sp. NPDC089406 TaxID=3364463 RepID=UPI0038505CEA
MRLLLATFKHETNTFSTVPTPFESFFTGGNAITGQEAINAHENSGGALKETPSKLPTSRKWTAWRCRKLRFSAADYWKTK